MSKHEKVGLRVCARYHPSPSHFNIREDPLTIPNPPLCWNTRHMDSVPLSCISTWWRGSSTTPIHCIEMRHGGYFCTANDHLPHFGITKHLLGAWFCKTEPCCHLFCTTNPYPPLFWQNRASRCSVLWKWALALLFLHCQSPPAPVLAKPSIHWVLGSVKTSPVTAILHYQLPPTPFWQNQASRCSVLRKWTLLLLFLHHQPPTHPHFHRTKHPGARFCKQASLLPFLHHQPPTCLRFGTTEHPGAWFCQRSLTAPFFAPPTIHLPPFSASEPCHCCFCTANHPPASVLAQPSIQVLGSAKMSLAASVFAPPTTHLPPFSQDWASRCLVLPKWALLQPFLYHQPPPTQMNLATAVFALPTTYPPPLSVKTSVTAAVFAPPITTAPVLAKPSIQGVWFCQNEPHCCCFCMYSYCQYYC